MNSTQKAPIRKLGLFVLTNSLVSYANRHEPNPVPHAKPAQINPAHVDEEPSNHHAVRATRTFQGTIEAGRRA